MKKFILTLLFLSLLSIMVLADDTQNPAPVPQIVNITSSEPRVELWNTLTDQEKHLAYHMIRATEAGRPLLFNQEHRDALVMHKLFVTALNSRNFKKTQKIFGPQFQEFLRYAAVFEDQHGPYNTSNRKLLLKTVKPEQLTKLFVFSPDINETEKVDIVKLMTDPNYETLHHPEDNAGTGLENTGTNMYQKGITGKEVEEAIKNGLKIDLNSRVVKDSTGKLVIQKQALSESSIDPDTKEALTTIVSELQEAKNYSSSAHQQKQLDDMIAYLNKGDIQDFRNMNIEWVKDRTDSKVDLVIGWTEVYMDHKSQIGSWETYVEFRDDKLTDSAAKLAALAQYFEDKMPYGKFKKTFPKDYFPPAVLASWFHEIGIQHYSGFNLPNFDDIRRDVGAKNSIKVRFPAEKANPTHYALKHKNLKEFTPDATRDLVIQKWWDARNNIVLLHEIIGHGSGTYDKSKYKEGEDPTGALGPFGSALEEQRADLTALTFMNDPKLVEVGIYKNQGEADLTRKAAYDGYLAEFSIMTALDRNFSEAHLRGHLVFVNDLLKAGAVRFTAKNGSKNWSPENVVLEVNDYSLFHATAVKALEELQAIKATRNVYALNKMFTDRAPLDSINLPWAKGFIARGEKIHIDESYVDQPWYINSDMKLVTEGKLNLSSAAQTWVNRHQNFTTASASQ